MPFSELVAPSLTDLFVKQMEHMILTGELKAGERLPTERQLSQQMRVSLAVVNGGINKLADYGFLTIKPRKGVYVNDFIRTGNMRTLEAIMSFMGSYFSPEYYEPLSAVRKKVEPLIIEAACTHRTEENLDNLRAVCEKYNKVQEVNRAAEAGYEFLHEMAIAGGNVIYPMLVAEAKELIIGSYKDLFSIIGKGKYHKFFDGLLEALEQKDKEKALQLFGQYASIWDDLYNGEDE